MTLWGRGGRGGHTPGKWQVLSAQHKSWAVRAQATSGLNCPLYTHSLHCGERNIPPNWSHDSSIYWAMPFAGPKDWSPGPFTTLLIPFRLPDRTSGRRRSVAAGAPGRPGERKRLSHREAGARLAGRGGPGRRRPLRGARWRSRPHPRGCREPPLTRPEELSQRGRCCEGRRGGRPRAFRPRRVRPPRAASFRQVRAAGRQRGRQAFGRGWAPGPSGFWSLRLKLEYRSGLKQRVLQCGFQCKLLTLKKETSFVSKTG